MKEIKETKVTYVTDETLIDSILKQKYTNMISRCMRECVHKNQPCYRGVTVCEEWTGKDGYTNFKKYIMDTTGVYYCDGSIAQFDKDLLSVPGEAKGYGEGTALLIPAYMNKALEFYVLGDQVSYDPYEDVYSLRLGKKREATTKTYDEAVAQFCEWRDTDLQKLIEKYDGIGLPDVVMDALRAYDVYAQNGLNRSDWV